MIDVKQYETEFKESQEIANEIAIKMSIARQGIDPETISRQDFDRIMRGNMAILDIREKANTQINLINQTAAEEHNNLVAKIQDALARYHPTFSAERLDHIAEEESEPVTQFTSEKEKETITPEDVGKAEDVLGTA